MLTALPCVFGYLVWTNLRIFFLLCINLIVIKLNCSRSSSDGKCHKKLEPFQVDLSEYSLNFCYTFLCKFIDHNLFNLNIAHAENWSCAHSRHFKGLLNAYCYSISHHHIIVVMEIRLFRQ